MNLKAFARFLYANVPGAAAIRFAVKDLTAAHVRKPEFGGIPRLLIGDGLILDIGANRGQSIAAFKKLAPHSNIVAFEPEPSSAERLSARYLLDPTVTIHGCALGSQTGILTFFVPSYGRWDCDGMPATSLAAATDWLKDPGRMFHFDEAKLKVREYEVRCATLDSFQLSPKLMKLHAQGAELDILKGAQETLSGSAPALMCAFPQSDLTDFLRRFKYQPYVYSEDRFVPGCAPPGATFTWFLRDEHLRHI